MTTEIQSTAAARMNRIVAATSFSFVVTQLDVTVVNVALPHIASSLSVQVSGLQWVVDAYTLPFAVFMLSAGVLGDRYGSRRTYLMGLAIFAAASLACGLAPNVSTLIAARAAQGAGAALLIPSSLALLNHAAANDHKIRAHAVGLWTAAGSVAIAAGPVVGGLMVAAMGWRSIFLINLPLCIVGAVLTFQSVSSTTHTDTTHHLDPLGQLLAILALTGLTCSVIEFRPLGMHHPLVIGGATLAMFAGIAFYFAETKSAEPMLPFGLFGLPNFSPSVVFGTIVNLTFYGTISGARIFGPGNGAGLLTVDVDVYRLERCQRSGGGSHGPAAADDRRSSGDACGICDVIATGSRDFLLRDVAAIHCSPRGDGLCRSGHDGSRAFQRGSKAVRDCIRSFECREADRRSDRSGCLWRARGKHFPTNRARTEDGIVDLSRPLACCVDRGVEIHPPNASTRGDQRPD
jgi:MFS family permease